jgi:hypothetical protein
MTALPIINADQIAQAQEIFRAARAAHADTVSIQPPDYLALSNFHTNEMQRLAAPGKVLDILAHYDLTLLTAAQRWERLPAASRRILESFQAAGGGSYVPFTTGESP